MSSDFFLAAIWVTLCLAAGKAAVYVACALGDNKTRPEGIGAEILLMLWEAAQMLAVSAGVAYVLT
jgi:hypothetical protein